MFSLAEVTLMEKQLLYLLDFDLRMTEDELLQHFEPFMRKQTPRVQITSSPPQQANNVEGTPARSLRSMPSLETCSPASSASTPSPVTPGHSERYYHSATLHTPSHSPIRRTSPGSNRYERRPSAPTMEKENDESHRSARGNIASLQAAAQQAARRGSSTDQQQHQQLRVEALAKHQAQLNLPFTPSELAQARRDNAALQHKSGGSGNLLASVRGYFKGMNTSSREVYYEQPETIIVDGGIRIVQS